MRLWRPFPAAVSALAIAGSLVAGCAGADSSANLAAGGDRSGGEPGTGSVVTGAGSLGTARARQDEPTTVTTSPRRVWATGEMDPVTTTTTSPTEPRAGDGPCDGEQALRVTVTGSDGLPITAQISADFTKDGKKVDATGQPIPEDQYSQTTFLNAASGITQVCFPAVPHAEVYLEVYPKDFVDGAYTSRSKVYGSVMWHGVWAGPGQGVYLRAPLACRPEGRGKTGTVNVKAIVAGHETPLRRLVAWSRAAGSAKVTPGFAVADASQYEAPEVKRIENVASDQDYLLQAQTADDKVLTVSPVPVKACEDTNVEVDLTGSGCSAKVNDEAGKDCKLLTKPLG